MRPFNKSISIDVWADSEFSMLATSLLLKQIIKRTAINNSTSYPIVFIDKLICFNYLLKLYLFNACLAFSLFCNILLIGLATANNMTAATTKKTVIVVNNPGNPSILSAET